MDLAGRYVNRSASLRLFCATATVVLAIFCSMNVPSSRGQAVSTGVVTGQVVDPQDKFVVGAAVTLTDVSTGSARSTQTNDVGRYVFTQVPPGTYNVSVTKEGFSQTRISDQAVAVGLTLTVNVQLKVGASSQTVEVTYTPGAELQTMNSTMGTTIDGNSVLLLPNIGREAAALATLQPAVTPNGYTAGAVNDQNTYQLDGGNISDDMAGSNNIYTPSLANPNPVATGGAATGVIPTPVESIEEVKVSVNNQTADFNSSAGSQVQMVTKRGTNQFHGSLYEYYLDSRVGGANTWDNNRLGVANPSAHRNRFGGSLGGPLTPSFWGGRTYFFANYEGLRYPFNTTIEREVPSALLRQGIVQINNSGTVTQYNFNPSLGPLATCQGGPCDPRGIGFNTLVQKIWNTQMPMPNDPSAGDTLNTQGFLAPISLPVTSNFGVVRMDHDFGSKWHFMGSYRYYHFQAVTANQTDIGGVLPGDTLGQYKSAISRPLVPSYYVAGLTTNITPTFTNDFHYSYTRNFWQWNSALAPPQLSGLPAPIEIGGESGSTNHNTAYGGGQDALIPYNVDTQDVRARYWDGHDHAIRDDLSLIHGNHLFQFGGLYQHTLDIHQRDDNGVSTFTGLVYVSGGTSATNMAMPTAYQPVGLPSSQLTSVWQPLYEQVLGIITQPQVIYTRSGSNLTLNSPPNTPVTAHSIIPTYNVYFSDSWRMRPTFTFTYGLAWTLEMPPYETNGLQTMAVDQSGTPITAENYLRNRQTSALNGQVFLPQLGYELVGNAGRKYPYNPFYGGFSPHVAAAWNPRFTNGVLGKVFGQGHTVIRGGWSRIFGRLNGVDLVLVPLLGSGPLQPITCPGASMAGQCLGAGKVDPTNAFRIGTDGTTAPLPTVAQTLPQPNFTGINSAKAGDTSQLDPNFRPSRSDEFDLSIQRELPGKMLLELGYVGRIIRNEYQAVDLDSVPWMMTMGGQSFANAFDSLYSEIAGGQPIQPQAFFESALGGMSSAFCSQANPATGTPFTSCSAAVVGQQKSNITNVALYNLWTKLPFTFGNSLLSQQQANSLFMETSLGWGNYNAAIVSLTGQNYHGLTVRSNFTWSRSMGTGDTTQSTSSFSVPNPFDLSYGYGPQSYDYRFLYNLTLLYQPAYFRSQHGLTGHLLGGWSIAPIFTAYSGAPLRVTGPSTCSSTWGEVSCSSSLNAWENAVLTSAYTAGNSAHYGVTSSGSFGTSGNSPKGTGINLFGDPNAVAAQFRPLLPGVDTNAGGNGVLRGLPGWNVDATIAKDLLFRERLGATFLFQFSNVFNHVRFADPTLSLANPSTFGVITRSAAGSTTIPLYTPRQLEFGVRVHF